MLKIRELRLEKEIEQQELAKIIKIGKGSISNWEVGRTEPSIEYIIKLADFFGVTTDELLGREYEVRDNRPGLGITPLENELLAAFRKLSADDQTKTVGVVKALAVMS